jgi:hypothetical protein
MEHYDKSCTDRKEHVDFWAEKQKLSNNIKTFRTTAEQHSLISGELKRVLAEAVTTCQDAQDLQLRINTIAEKFGL